MSDARLARLADVLVGYSGGVREGDVVLLEGSDLAAPLLVELHRSILRAGAYSLPRLQVDGLAEVTFAEASDEQLEWVNPVRADELDHVDVRIHVSADWNTKSLTGVDPSRQALRQREDARFVSGEYDQKFVDGQIIKERRYSLTSQGDAAWSATRAFYTDAIDAYGAPRRVAHA